MNFTPTSVDGAYLIEWEPQVDERGYFARTRADDEFSAHGLKNSLSECGVSFNARRGTLRGMHFQTDPHQETKLVTCIGGLIFDAIVDLRADSTTYLQAFTTELSLANRRMLYVPAGVAHGFLSLQDNSYVQYQISGKYAPEAASGVRWNDPQFDINWPMQPLLMSDRDRDYKDFIA